MLTVQKKKEGTDLKMRKTTIENKTERRTEAWRKSAVRSNEK